MRTSWTKACVNVFCKSEFDRVLDEILTSNFDSNEFIDAVLRLRYLNLNRCVGTYQHASPSGFEQQCHVEQHWEGWIRHCRGINLNFQWKVFIFSTKCQHFKSLNRHSESTVVLYWYLIWARALTCNYCVTKNKNKLINWQHAKLLIMILLYINSHPHIPSTATPFTANIFYFNPFDWRF